MNLRDTGIQSLPFPTSATPQTTLSQTVELQGAGFVFNGTKNKIFLYCVAPSPRYPGSVSLRHRPDPRARTEPRGSPAGRARPPARRGLARRSPAQPRRSALSPAAAGGERGGGRPPSRACPRPSAVRARVPAYAPRPTAARPGPAAAAAAAAAAPPPPRVPPAHSPRTSRSLRFRHLLASLRGRGCAGALGAAGHVMAPAAILSPRPSERAVLRLGRCRGSACSNS